jgi:5'-3' exonuclease
MGIADFLKNVLESAGRPMDLREMNKGIFVQTRDMHKRKRRSLRIAIDVSSWVYKAAHGFGDMLADERHLTNYGRAALLQEQKIVQQQEDTTTHNAPAGKTKEEIQEYVTACTQYVIKRLETLREQSKADLLVVLDGATPPVKTNEVQRRRSQRREHVRQRDEPVDLQADEAANERRTKAFRRAGAGRHYSEIIAELIRILKQSSIAFMVAPYEADSQLAYMSINGYIDLIVTEDSDLVAHGAKAILYKSIGEIGGGIPRGILLRQCDLGSVMGSLYLADFTPVMLAALFVAVGCDYCDKLKGIGLVKACRAVRKAFLEPRPNSALAALFAQLYEQSYTSHYTDEFKRDYEESVMSALLMYRHPIVFDPIERECLEVGDPDHYGDPELIEHEPYAKLLKDKERRKLIVGAIPLASESTAVAESHQGKAAYVDKTSNEDDELDSSDDELLGTQQDVTLPGLGRQKGPQVDSSDDEGLGTQQDAILPSLGRRKGPKDADIFDEKKQGGLGTENEEKSNIPLAYLSGKRETVESSMKAADISGPGPGKVVDELDSSDDEGLGTHQDVILPSLGRRKGPRDADIFDEKKQEGIGPQDADIFDEKKQGAENEEESNIPLVHLSVKRKTVESSMKAADVPGSGPEKVVAELDSSDDEGLGKQQHVILPGLGRRKGPQDADIFDEKKQEGLGTENEEEENTSLVQLSGKRKTAESSMKAADIPSPDPGNMVDKPEEPQHTIATENDSNRKRKTAESNLKAAGIPSPSPGNVVHKPEQPQHTIATEDAASAICVLTNVRAATPAGKKNPSQNSNGSSSKKLSQASSNDDTNMSSRSPNLLYSSTPEKTQASQGTHMSSPSLTQLPQTQA